MFGSLREMICGIGAFISWLLDRLPAFIVYTSAITTLLGFVGLFICMGLESFFGVAVNGAVEGFFGPMVVMGGLVCMITCIMDMRWSC